MRRRPTCLIWLTLTVGGCGGVTKDAAVGGVRSTTDSAIAIANLDHLIAQEANAGSGEELLLLRATLLADYEAFDSVAALTEGASTAEGSLRRARCRSAVHRFAEALADTDAAGLGGRRPARWTRRAHRRWSPSGAPKR
jgi:hypothetical protein